MGTTKSIDFLPPALLIDVGGFLYEESMLNLPFKRVKTADRWEFIFCLQKIYCKLSGFMI